MSRITLFTLLTLAGCGPVPADMQGTEESLRHGDTLVIGIVDSGDGQSRADRIARQTAETLGYSYRTERGPAEDILPALEDGEIDLVIGRFAKASPWKARVLLSRAIGPKPVSGKEPVWRYATRNGENRWAMTIDELTQP